MLLQGSLFSPLPQGVIGTDEWLGEYLGAEKKVITTSVVISPDHSKPSTAPRKHYQNSILMFSQYYKTIPEIQNL